MNNAQLYLKAYLDHVENKIKEIKETVESLSGDVWRVPYGNDTQIDVETILRITHRFETLTEKLDAVLSGIESARIKENLK